MFFVVRLCAAVSGCHEFSPQPRLFFAFGPFEPFIFFGLCFAGAAISLFD